MKIAGYCSWKDPGEKKSYVGPEAINGVELEFCWNEPSYQGDYVVDMEPPFSPISVLYNPKKRIYVTTEPSLFDSYTSRFDPNEVSEYYQGLILSWHPNLLRYPQTKPFQPAAKWVGPIALGTPKTFGVSGFVSAKNDPSMDGYTLRHFILSKEFDIKIPSMVYNYRKSWRGQEQTYPVESKIIAMDHMFHLAIENCREKYYFTEKLIDCFACRVVPLYFGDPNVASVFNKDGMIFLDQHDPISQINNLKMEDYTSRLNAIEDNYKRAEEYWSIDRNMAKNIIKYLARD